MEKKATQHTRKYNTALQYESQLYIKKKTRIYFKTAYYKKMSKGLQKK